MKKPNILLLGFLLLVGNTSLHAQGVDERGILAAASELDHAIDDKNWKRVRALLLKEVTLVLPGMEPETLPADELIARWQANLHPGKNSFHLRGNEVVTFDGADSAILRSKAQVWYEVAGIAGDDVYEFWANYVHELDRGEDGWRVRRIGYDPQLERGNLAVKDHRLSTATAESSAADETGDSAKGTGKKESSDDTDESADNANPDQGKASPTDNGDAGEPAEPAVVDEGEATDKATPADAESDSVEATDAQ